MRTVLIIDDDHIRRLIYSAWLTALAPNEFTIINADNAETGKTLFADSLPDCVVLDYLMIGQDGFQVLHEMQREFGSACPPILFISCALSETLRRNALALGAYACFDKNELIAEQFVATVRDAITSRRKP